MARPTLESYYLTSPPQLPTAMTQRNAGVLCPSGSDLFLKFFVNWGYDDFSGDTSQSFELATLGFPALTTRPIEIGIACITHSLLAFFPYFLATHGIVYRCWLIEMQETY